MCTRSLLTNVLLQVCFSQQKEKVEIQRDIGATFATVFDSALSKAKKVKSVYGVDDWIVKCSKLIPLNKLAFDELRERLGGGELAVIVDGKLFIV